MLILLLAFATAAAALTITRSSITQPLRDIFLARSAVLFKLFSCPYCMSHWIAAALVAASNDQLGMLEGAALNFVSCWLAVVGVSAVICSYVMTHMMRQEDEITRLRNTLSETAIALRKFNRGLNS